MMYVFSILCGCYLWQNIFNIGALMMTRSMKVLLRWQVHVENASDSITQSSAAASQCEYEGETIGEHALFQRIYIYGM